MKTDQSATITDRCRVFPQYVIPQHILSRLVYRLVRCRWKVLKNFLIKLYIALYKPDLSETSVPDNGEYENFNAFFTRSLKATARPISQDIHSIISPVDGYTSQLGRIENNRLLQAKNRYYSLDALLAEDQAVISRFAEGLFITLYLSPGDYHRVHMPLDGNLLQMSHIPGKLFSVNNCTSRVVDRLYARNERIFCLFETSAGPMLVIMVGAIFVGSMETVWSGEMIPSVSGSITRDTYNNAVHLKKGEELGRFNMGSTVILLLGNPGCSWLPGLQPGDQIRMGSVLGKTGG